MARPLKDWIAASRHLPPFLRDFHDQKEVFRMVEHLRPSPPGDPYRVNWIAAQCYTIDRFLKLMAMFGWTLQRTRHDGPFADLDAEIAKMKKAEEEAFAALLGLHPVPATAATPGAGDRP